MAETSMRTLLVSGILFTMLILGVFSAVSLVKHGTGRTDGIDAVTEFATAEELKSFNNSFNRIDKTISNLTTIKNKLSSASPDKGVLEQTLSLSFVSATWSSLKLLFGVFTFLDDIFAAVFAWFGIPELDWLIVMLGALVGIVVIFGIINIIFGRSD